MYKGAFNLNYHRNHFYLVDLFCRGFFKHKNSRFVFAWKLIMAFLENLFLENLYCEVTWFFTISLLTKCISFDLLKLYLLKFSRTRTLALQIFILQKNLSFDEISLVVYSFLFDCVPRSLARSLGIMIYLTWG
jgi:hypothetical protein